MRCASRICITALGRRKSYLGILISVHSVKIICRCMTQGRGIGVIFHPSRSISVMIWVGLLWRKTGSLTKKPMTSKNLWSSNKTWSPSRSQNYATFTQSVRSFSNCFSVVHLLCKYLNSLQTIICMKPPQIQTCTKSPTFSRTSFSRTTCVKFA